MTKLYKNCTIAYITLLAATLGASIYAGAVVAAVTFNTTDIFEAQLLTRFQEGLIMTVNFYKLCFAMVVVIFATLLYEGFTFIKVTSDYISAICGLVTVVCMILFCFYYVPEITKLQEQGEAFTQSEQFAALHHASEINFKIAIAALSGLVIKTLHRSIKVG